MGSRLSLQSDNLGFDSYLVECDYDHRRNVPLHHSLAMDQERNIAHIPSRYEQRLKGDPFISQK